MEPVVYIVNMIDSEGPLYESIDETFVRLKEIFDLDLEPTWGNLNKLQNMEIDLGGIEEKVAAAFNRHNQDMYDTWDKINVMLDELMSDEFRTSLPDSFGNGWIFNWCCVDHVDYWDNPRRRDMGYHNIFDHYARVIKNKGAPDQIYFHYHPIALSRSAHHCATHYFATGDRFFQILSRRIIDRKWFPAVNRPGFHVTRPDSHWFMEQYITFDIANEGTDQDYSHNLDIADGRFGDWRRAPISWTPYHPSHDDYQLPGNCRRWIARCLQVGGRGRLLRQQDVDQAFSEASDGSPVILAFSNHDFRDMRADVNNVREMLRVACERYPGVKFRYSDVRDAMRSALNLPDRESCDLVAQLEEDRLHVESEKGIFGPQPYLALKTKSGNYYHDNFDIQKPFHEWTYTFDHTNAPVGSLEKIGVASSDDVANVTVITISPDSGEVEYTHI